jgi:hypothetical protein
MKSLLVLTVMVFSFNSFALDVTAGQLLALTSLPSAYSNLSSGSDWKAEQVIEDSNAYYQSGELSLKLEEMVRNIQNSNEVSEREAVDMLSDLAADSIK